MPPPAFPTLKGQGWSVRKRPSFSTRIAKHVSGREVRSPFYSSSLYEFELVFDGLDSNGSFPGLGTNSLQTLMSLYLQCQGSYGSFLYTDPTDSSATVQLLGTGNGTRTAFTFQRMLGSTIEPVSYVTSVANVYLNGVNQASGWTFAAPRTLTFTSAPGSGVAVTATFNFAFECRFLEDQAEFENFMSGLWKVESLKFRSVKS
jgi:uncharacterized protein (TIGR02217 family)